VLDEIQQRSLGPVDVIEYQRQGLSRRAALEIAAEAPAKLLLHRLGRHFRKDVLATGRSSEHAEPPRDGLGVLGRLREAREHRGPQLPGRFLVRVHRGDPGVRAEDLDDRPERDALAIWQTAAAPDAVRNDGFNDLVHEPGTSRPPRFRRS